MSSRLVQSLALSSVIAIPLLGQDPREGVLRQVTHAQNYDPSFAPDGRHMVYISVVAGREQLFVSLIDGTDARQLTTDSIDHEDPAWSPDGTTIAFVYLTQASEQIATVPVGGGPTILLTPDSERAIHPNWAPDGRHLAYCTDDDLAPPRKNPSDIKVIDLATRQTRVLITNGVNTYPAWSPDGRYLAFRRMLGEHNSEVFLADSNGTHIRNLTNHPAFDGWPAWSPDGRYLTFASNRDGDYQIYVMRADGSAVQLVAPSTGRGTAPKWSPDGRAIYFSICRRDATNVDCEIYAASPPSG
jgi:TolB protein